MEANIFDLIVIVLVASLAIKGLMNGFIKEVFGFIGMIGGIFIASRFSEAFGGVIETHLFTIDNPSMKSVAGFAGLFLVIWIGALIGGWIIAKMVRLSGLGFFDRLGGAIVGGGKIFLVFAVLAYGLGNLKFFQNLFESRLETSMMFPLLYEAGSHIVMLDHELITEAKTQTLETKEQLEEHIKKDMVQNAREQLEDGQNGIEGMRPDSLQGGSDGM